MAMSDGYRVLSHTFLNQASTVTPVTGGGWGTDNLVSEAGNWAAMYPPDGCERDQDERDRSEERVIRAGELSLLPSGQSMSRRGIGWHQPDLDCGVGLHRHDAAVGLVASTCPGARKCPTLWPGALRSSPGAAGPAPLAACPMGRSLDPGHGPPVRRSFPLGMRDAPHSRAPSRALPGIPVRRHALVLARISVPSS